MPVVVAAARPLPSTTVPRRSIVYAILASVGFIGGGVVIAAIAFSTNIVGGFMAPRPTPAEMAAGAVAWALALIVPGAFVILGLTRLLDAAELTAARRRPPPPASRLAPLLGDEHVVACRVRLPDGRIVPELVVGPFGVAVVEELPPPHLTRNRGGRWELHLGRGRWAPIENPLDRASRDADRVRGWLAHEDHDHVVKVYAAVIAPAGSLSRTPTCAVVEADQLAAWLGSLPVQRSLYADRRARIAELVAASVV